MKTSFLVCVLLFSLAVWGQNRSARSDKFKKPIDTVYIPVDLDDCLRQLDKLFADSIRAEIKTITEDEFSGRYHHGLGTWMRNNWGLWKGSALSAWFKGLGVYHPDDMTGIVFDSYHRMLTGKERKLDEQIRYYQDYWKKMEENRLEKEREAFSDYNIGDTVSCRYASGFISKKQEKKNYDNSCVAKAIVMEKDTSHFWLKVRLIEACDKKGIVSYDNRGTYVWDKSKKKLVKNPQRVIKYMKVDEVLWYNYSDWFPKD